jgi:hypothetical protein
MHLQPEKHLIRNLNSNRIDEEDVRVALRIGHESIAIHTALDRRYSPRRRIGALLKVSYLLHRSTVHDVESAAWQSLYGHPIGIRDKDILNGEVRGDLKRDLRRLLLGLRRRPTTGGLLRYNRQR